MGKNDDFLEGPNRDSSWGTDHAFVTMTCRRPLLLDLSKNILCLDTVVTRVVRIGMKTNT